MADMPAGYTFGAQAIRSLQETARQTKRAALNRPHDQYAAPPDVSSPEIHPILCTSGTPDPTTNYYAGTVLQCSVGNPPPVQNLLGACWLWPINGEALAANVIYHCRLYGPNPGDGKPVFAPIGYESTATIFVEVNGGVSPTSAYIFDGLLVSTTPNSPTFNAPAGAIWIASYNEHVLQPSFAYRATPNGTYTAIPFGGGAAVQRPLYMVLLEQDASASQPGIVNLNSQTMGNGTKLFQDSVEVNTLLAGTSHFIVHNDTSAPLPDGTTNVFIVNPGAQVTGVQGTLNVLTQLFLGYGGAGLPPGSIPVAQVSYSGHRFMVDVLSEITTVILVMGPDAYLGSYLGDSNSSLLFNGVIIAGEGFAVGPESITSGATPGVSGSFTAGAHTVTVTKGIITSIV